MYIQHNGNRIKLSIREHRNVKQELHSWATYWIKKRAQELRMSEDKFREVLKR